MRGVVCWDLSDASAASQVLMCSCCVLLVVASVCALLCMFGLLTGFVGNASEAPCILNVLSAHTRLYS